MKNPKVLGCLSIHFGLLAFVLFGMVPNASALVPGSGYGISCEDPNGCMEGYKLVSFADGNSVHCVCVVPDPTPPCPAEGVRLIRADQIAQALGPNVVTELSSTTESERDPGDSTADLTLSVPLGVPFFLAYFKAESGSCDRSDRPSTFEIANVELNPSLAEAGEDVLWRNTTLITLSPLSGNFTTEFLPIHTGKTEIAVTPDGGSTVIATIYVTNPTAIDRNDSKDPHNEVDQFVIQWGNLRGVPITFLKSIIEKESRFKSDAYRYEPITNDCESMEKKLSNGNALYTPYKLPNGISLTQADKDARTKVFPPFKTITSAGVGPNSLVSGIYPKASELVVGSNGVSKSDPDVEDGIKGAHWAYDDQQIEAFTAQDLPVKNFGVCHKKIVLGFKISDDTNFFFNNPSLIGKVIDPYEALDFVAQTALSSSFGLMQVMYDLARDDLKWTGLNGLKNPASLFDSNENISLGTKNLAKRMKGDYKSRYDNYESFLIDLHRLANRYNLPANDKIKSTDYGALVLLKMRKYEYVH